MVTPLDLAKAIQEANGYRENRIKNVKSLRVGIDALLQAMHRLVAEESSDEMITATRRARESVMWMGMELKRLGELNPYPNSYNPTNTVVDPTADNLKL